LAQETRWPAVGNRAMSIPVSARIAHAAMELMPGISSGCCAAVAKGMIISSILASSAAMSASSASTRASIFSSKNAWWLVKKPVNASSSAVILPRIAARAICASTLGLRSPAISAASICRPETPKMSEATTLSLIWASSSSFSARCFSAVRAPTRSAR